MSAEERQPLSPPTREQVLREQAAIVKRASDAAAAEQRRETRAHRVAFALILVVLLGLWRVIQPFGTRDSALTYATVP